MILNLQTRTPAAVTNDDEHGSHMITRVTRGTECDHGGRKGTRELQKYKWLVD